MKKILFSIAIAIAIIICTILVLFYAKGYRINLTENTVIQTGILHLETQPSRANFYLTEDFQGRTPRAVSSIPIGNYKLNVWLDGYHSIEYEVEIFPEKSTPIFVFLFKKEPEEKILATVENPFMHIHTDSSHRDALIFTQTEILENQKSYEILKYQTNTRFWQRSKNPSKIFDFTIGHENEIEKIVVSPNSKNFLLTISGNNAKTSELDNKILTSGKYVISLETQDILVNMELDEDIKWSSNGENLIWQDEEGIKKINLKQPETISLVYPVQKGKTILSYDIYSNGEVYILYQEEGNDYVTLSQIILEEETFLIEKIFFQTEARFLDSMRDKDFIEHKPFTNSPQSTLFVGKPNSFFISKEKQILFFHTDYASYIYDTKEDKYMLLNPYKTEILSFAPDGKKVSFLDLENEKLGFYIFDKEKSNYSITLGGSYLDNHINKGICSDFAWHSNSQNIYYVCENTLYVADIKKDKSIRLVDNFGQNILLENSGKVITLRQADNMLDIVEFIVN